VPLIPPSPGERTPAALAPPLANVLQRFPGDPFWNPFLVASHFYRTTFSRKNDAANNNAPSTLRLYCAT